MSDPIHDSDSFRPVPLGVCAETGKPLPAATPSDLSGLTWSLENRMPVERRARARFKTESVPHWGLIGEIRDPNDLRKCGWGAIAPQDTDYEIIDALEPLIRYRREEAGPLFKLFTGDSGFKAGDSAERWLSRQGVNFGPVSPALGVPYYLLLLGSPAQISNEFQYELDLYFAVGRLSLENADAYRRYAENTVIHEQGKLTSRSKRILVFAPEHNGDAATRMCVNKLALPLINPHDPYGPLGSGQGFAISTLIGEGASKKALLDAVGGCEGGVSPAIVFTGTHGLACASDNPRRAELQGSIICSDWDGRQSLNEDHWISGSDLADRDLTGLIHIAFACYSGGYPVIRNSDALPGPLDRSEQIVLSRLPEKMLGKPKGALAVLAHIDKAWIYSFTNTQGHSQPETLRDVIGRLAAGDRLGNATDLFNFRWAILGNELLENLRDRARGLAVSELELTNRWIARNDARNYVVLGDPAVRVLPQRNSES